MQDKKMKTEIILLAVPAEMLLDTLIYSTASTSPAISLRLFSAALWAEVT